MSPLDEVERELEDIVDGLKIKVNHEPITEEEIEEELALEYTKEMKLEQDADMRHTSGE